MSVAAPSPEDSDAEALRRAQRAHEPSMEEILASIRAIIADDRDPPPPAKAGPQIVYSSDAAGTARPSAAPEPAEPAPAATVVWARPPENLAKAPPPPEPAAPTVVWTRPPEVISAAPPPPSPPPPLLSDDPVEDDEPLLSDEAGGAVAASFEALSQSLASHGLEIAENLTRELLKPMLKSWLDENLPSMVERLVRAEIARLARSAR